MFTNLHNSVSLTIVVVLLGLFSCKHLVSKLSSCVILIIYLLTVLCAHTRTSEVDTISSDDRVNSESQMNLPSF